MNHQTNEKVTTTEGQTERCLMGVKQVLEAAGASMEDVVTLNILITDQKNTDSLNEPVKRAFPGGPAGEDGGMHAVISPGHAGDGGRGGLPARKIKIILGAARPGLSGGRFLCPNTI